MLGIDNYLTSFTRLKRGGNAPHKPILLITLIELISSGQIRENKVLIDAELIGTIQENWRLLSFTSHDTDFTQPFFHLQNDTANGQPFWYLFSKPGYAISKPIKNVVKFAEALAFGCFAADLFILLQDAQHRHRLLDALLNRYFPTTCVNYQTAKALGAGYFSELERYMLNEPVINYQSLAIQNEDLENFVRGGLFKKKIPEIYNHTCCITGMRLESTFGHTLIDACHIEPFSLNGNDQITNGLALCPNLHRAFDRGLISVDDQYRVITSPHLREDQSHPYSLGQLHGQPLRLPHHNYQRPALAHLEWHRGNVFRG
jgi:putative restriction endonuclease